MTNKCKGFFGWAFGHKFMNVHDEHTMPKENDNIFEHLNVNILFSDDVKEIVKCRRERKKTYVKSICERCGKIIERI